MSFPALASVLPQLVPREQLQPANVLMSMARNSLIVVGPSVAALLVVSVGAGWALAVDGVTYLLAATLLLRVRLPPAARRTDKPSMLVELREGWSFFVGTRWLWLVVAAFCLVCAIHQGAFFTLGPVLAKTSEIGAGGWGLILSVEAVGLLLTIGQLAAGPLALAFGIQNVILGAGILLVVIALLTLLSRSVRDLPRVTTVVST